ncbi:MAG: hypothetical protein KatS3mg122_3033 [Caldimonas sp.]|uniref:hypothetical protein n=1 Tax=Caldimonas taiwanensis TaxID=307483 RepID=UPI000783963B|nr:hypothetical protein [Caldimonas taiwanensis]GIX25802.1 MAG: hypothetical protein KatS3mg122_3033 [Caldimonas sp.]
MKPDVLSPVSMHEEEHELPCAEGLLAASLALMTGYSDPAACPAHRPLLARKISENLAALCEHPLLNPNFRTVLWGLCQRWQARCESEARHGAGAASPSAVEGRLPWVKAPATLQ